MRTLKKSLALVLALVMVLGLGVVGASADNKLDDYTDAKDIGDAYVEAVGVMTGLEIVDGMTETTIDPTATYTREQAAKIIAYMVLGKSAADSLTCTVAPFDDVAADRWSAGYISFCVEQGIIDGMTDTTFEPTGTLTGFQWAKMLLSAVGFNANGEFTGDSWSLNTARVAHSVGLFTGDAAGADHIALQRQQAMLYAFNTLTKVNCVVWSEALGDYIYKYNGFADRYTYQGTLGWNVFKLASVEGIINDNEATGGPDTRVYVGTNKYAYIEANTGLDMMYHAARVWYVDADNNADTLKGTSVYVNDLASAKNSSCLSLDKVPSKYETREIGKKTGYQLYERSLVDNPDGYSDYAVDFYYTTTYLGARSTEKDFTAIDGVGFVDNDKIWTDISAINNDDQIIMLVAESARNSGNANLYAYHIFAVGNTSGNVAKYDASNKTITLTDGTVLAQSVFFNNTAELNAMIAILDNSNNSNNSKPAYSFTLDTHGHYMNLSDKPFQALAYFTGTYHETSAHDAWYGEAEYVAQFALVKNGTKVEVPVTANWIRNYANATVVANRGYFDITDELYDQEVYYPEWKDSSDNVYGASYAIVDDTVNISAKTHTVSTNKGDVYFDYDTVTYLVATGYGSNFNVQPLTGNAELIEYYAEKFGVDFESVTLDNVALYMTGTVGNNYSAVTIFVYDDIQSAHGGIVFFPKTVTTDWVVEDSWYWVGGAYIDGAEVEQTIKVKNQADTTVEAGFYTYTVDADGFFTLTPVGEGKYYYLSENDDMYIAGDPMTKAWLKVNANTEIEIDVENVKVIDLRVNKEYINFDTMSELSNLLAGNYNGFLDEVYVDVAAVVVNNTVKYFYVVDANYGTVTVDTSRTNLLDTKGTATPDKVNLWGGETEVTVTLKTTSSELSASAIKTLHYTVNGVAHTVAGSDMKQIDTQTVSFTVKVPSETTVIAIGEYVRA